MSNIIDGIKFVLDHSLAIDNMVVITREELRELELSDLGFVFSTSAEEQEYSFQHLQYVGEVSLDASDAKVLIYVTL